MYKEDKMENKISKKSKIIGWICSGLPLLFLIMDSVFKLIKSEEAVKGTIELGYPESILVPLGIILLTCSILYLIPKTSIFGAILLTAYFGGAVATHVRLEQPLFSHILFPVYLGILIWIGLALRTPTLKKALVNNS